MIGTTNLCRCGGFVPFEPDRCHCSRARRDLYLSRLRGPFVDRFSILAYTHAQSQSSAEITLGDIHSRVVSAIAFRLSARHQLLPNSRLPHDCLEKFLTSFQIEQMSTSLLTGSRRRMLAHLQVARTLADLDESATICDRHLVHARRLTVHNFNQLTTAAFS